MEDLFTIDYGDYKQRLAVGYKSPVEVIYDVLSSKIENDVLNVVQRYDIRVDKEELIRALQYDRNQYEEGYLAGYNAALRVAHDEEDKEEET